MDPLTINGRFTMTCPEGWRVMTEKEKQKLNQTTDGDSLTLIHEEGQMIASIGWKEVNAFAGFLLNIIRPVTSTEASVNQSMAGYGYRKRDALTREIGGVKAEGFRYTYTAGTPMVGESYVIRQGRSLTFFHVYLRDALREVSLERWNELLDAVQPL